MINSRDTELFEVGKEYWTCFLEKSSNGKRLINYTGIMKVRLTNKNPTTYKPKGYKVFEILESKPLGKTIGHNIYAYMEGYGCATCNFFNTKEECIKYHDKEIIKNSKGLNTKNRDIILSKLIVKQKIEKPTIEVNSILWYESLGPAHKSYVRWIKYYYEEIK